MITEKTVKDQQVKDFFRYALSQPPSVAGLRLRSEPELASLVGIGRWRIRGALENLIQEGFLVKRKGIGAFVRKVPSAPAGVEDKDFAEFENVSPRDIFLFDTSVDRRMKSQKKLMLSVCAHVHVPSVSQQVILGGIVDRANTLGHGVSMITFVDRHEDMLPVAKRRERLANNHCDGYLVLSDYGKEFYESVPSRDIPVLFGTETSWTFAGEYEPRVAIDDLEAISRAVDILAGQGYRRIAMIGIEDRFRAPDLKDKTYRDAMTRHGLDYRSVNYLPLNVLQIVETVRSIFSSPERPDAIYVSDDYIMVGVVDALDLMGLKAGRDLGVINLSTTHHHLPKHGQWSKMEFNLHQFGEELVDKLLRLIETSEHQLNNLMFQARWVPGQSHLRGT